MWFLRFLDGERPSTKSDLAADSLAVEAKQLQVEIAAISKVQAQMVALLQRTYGESTQANADLGLVAAGVNVASPTVIPATPENNSEKEGSDAEIVEKLSDDARHRRDEDHHELPVAAAGGGSPQLFNLFDDYEGMSTTSLEDAEADTEAPWASLVCGRLDWADTGVPTELMQMDAALVADGGRTMEASVSSAADADEEVPPLVAAQARLSAQWSGFRFRTAYAVWSGFGSFRPWRRNVWS